VEAPPPAALRMPTYEYQCQKCGHRFCEFQRIVDPPIKDCPECKKKDCVEQIISGGSGLIFKGSGFYETDYKRKSSGGGESSSGSGSDKKTSDNKKD
jgi:putative FmdB family regulatory protein